MKELITNYDGHRDRLRRKIETEGVLGLKPHELIEFLLYYPIPRQDVNPLARQLLAHFGSVQAILSADSVQLSQVEGVGRHTAQWLMLFGEVVKACQNYKGDDRIVLKNYMDFYRYGYKLYRRITPPETWQLCLDHGNHLLYQRCIAPSRTWGEPITLRDALSDVFMTGANNVVLLQFVGNCHAEYGKYDVEHINAYSYTLHAAGCQLLDMILIGDGGLQSMRQEGRIPDYSTAQNLRIIREDYLRVSPEEYSDGQEAD